MMLLKSLKPFLNECSFYLLPLKMFDKTKASQASAITDLQNELKSLKNLLLNRRIPINNNSNNTNVEQQPDIINTSAAPDATTASTTISTPSTSATQNQAASLTATAKFNIPAKPTIPPWQQIQQQQDTSIRAAEATEPTTNH